MNSICFTGVLALCCGCVFGDTAPVPVADGGKIVLREFPTRGGGTVSSSLWAKDDYGVMLVDETEGEGEPRMLIVVARRHPAEVYRVVSLDELEAVLRKFPAGAQFYRYDRCLAPAGYGLPEDTWDEIDAVMRKCGHHLANDDEEVFTTRITCTCGDDGSMKQKQSAEALTKFFMQLWWRRGAEMQPQDAKARIRQ